MVIIDIDQESALSSAAIRPIQKGIETPCIDTESGVGSEQYHIDNGPHINIDSNYYRNCEVNINIDTEGTCRSNLNRVSIDTISYA